MQVESVGQGRIGRTLWQSCGSASGSLVWNELPSFQYSPQYYTTLMSHTESNVNVLIINNNTQ